jgi:hypothetical protein
LNNYLLACENFITSYKEIECNKYAGRGKLGTLRHFFSQHHSINGNIVLSGVGLGGRFMTVINTSPPLFPLSLYPTEVTFAKPLVNIEILGTSEGGGK